MKINILIILFFILCCDTEEQLFKNVEIHEKESFLYVFPKHHSLKIQNNHDYKLKNGITIDNVQIINEIVNSWKFTKNDFTGTPTYSVQLIISGKPYYSLWLNADLNRAFTSHGEYNFDKQKLFEFERYFKPIVCYNVVIEELNNSIMFKNIIQTNGGYIVFGENNSTFEWEKYSGVTILQRKRFSLPIGKESEFKQIILNEFDENSNFDISEITTDNDSDSWLIKIFSDSIIIVPHEYEVVQKFDRFNHINFFILGLDKTKIEDLAKDNGIILEELKKVIL